MGPTVCVCVRERDLETSKLDNVGPIWAVALQKKKMRIKNVYRV
jgi:hypothetical protein